MRRAKRALSGEDTLAVIDRAPYGTVAMTSPEGLPYCVPLSLARVGEELFFHCALSGEKLDNLRKNPRVCVTFVSQAQPGYQAQENNFTCFYRSAIVTGTACEITDPQQKIAALEHICRRFVPQAMVEDNFQRAVQCSLSATGIWRIHMDTITGKAKKETPEG